MSVMRIRDDGDLKNAYWMMKYIEKYATEESVNNYLNGMKKAVRKYHMEQANQPERRYFDENTDGYRLFEETDYKSVAEAEEEHIVLTCYPDQIGRWFELSHKYFQRSDGKVCGYVHMAMNW